MKYVLPLFVVVALVCLGMGWTCSSPWANMLFGSGPAKWDEASKSFCSKSGQTQVDPLKILLVISVLYGVGFLLATSMEKRNGGNFGGGGMASYSADPGMPA